MIFPYTLETNKKKRVQKTNAFVSVILGKPRFQKSQEDNGTIPRVQDSFVKTTNRQETHNAVVKIVKQVVAVVSDI